MSDHQTPIQPSVPPETPLVTEEAERRRRNTLPWVLVAVLAVLLVVGGVGAYLYTNRGSALDRTDPIGARTCKTLASWIDGKHIDPKTAKPAAKALVAVELGETAKDAKTPAIKAAAGDDMMADPAFEILKDYGGPDSFRIANLQKMHAACVDAGATMPAYVEPAE